MKGIIREVLGREFRLYQEYDSLLSEKEAFLMAEDLEGLKEVTFKEKGVSSKLKELEREREQLLKQYCDVNQIPEKTCFSQIFTEKPEQEFLMEFRYLIKRVSARNEHVTTLLAYLVNFNHLISRAICDGINELTYEKDGGRNRKQAFNIVDMKA